MRGFFREKCLDQREIICLPSLSSGLCLQQLATIDTPSSERLAHPRRAWLCPGLQQKHSLFRALQYNRQVRATRKNEKTFIESSTAV